MSKEAQSVSNIFRSRLRLKAPIPKSLSDEKAVYCTDMMSTGFMGAEHTKISIGGTVAVFAQGPVGLMATAGARLLGAGLIIAVETDPKRMELARHFGADVVIDFKAQEPVRTILRAWTPLSRLWGANGPSNTASRQPGRAAQFPILAITRAAISFVCRALHGASG